MTRVFIFNYSSTYIHKTDQISVKGSFRQDKKCMQLKQTVVVQKIRTFLFFVALYLSAAAACGFAANFVGSEWA